MARSSSVGGHEAQRRQPDSRRVIVPLEIAVRRLDDPMTSASGEPHFTSEARGVPTGPGRFVTVSDIDAVEFVPGAAVPAGPRREGDGQLRVVRAPHDCSDPCP